jgi:hypothetical protein
MKYFLVIICLLVVFHACSRADETLPAGGLTISQASQDMILYYETGGQAYYASRLKHPCVPPGQSGITIGIGYDLGYNTKEQIATDWGTFIPAAQVARLQTVAGLKQSAAKAALIRVKDISIPWETAVAVYKLKTVPRFAAMTERAYPGITKLHPHIQGVVLSTSFNRGTAFSPYDRRKELVWTRDDVKNGKIGQLPSYQLQMRRLWPTIGGLQKRYSAHAGLMQRAVDNP